MPAPVSTLLPKHQHKSPTPAARSKKADTSAVLKASATGLKEIEAPRFDQHVVFTHDAFRADDLFALRNEAESEVDSGWSVAPVPEPGGQIDMSQLSAIPIYNLVDSYPELLSVFTLPTGYLVRLKRKRVVEISDPSGVVRWQ